MQREGIIEKVIYGGYSLLRDSEDEKIVLLDRGYPGERVKYTITKEKKDVDFASVDEILVHSRERVRPRCEYFEKCSGCAFMDIKYSSQLKLKREIIIDQISRITKLDPLEIEEKVGSVIGMNDPYYYRNKIELSVKKGEVGYIGKNGKILPIRECKIADKKINKVIRAISNALNEYPSQGIRHIIIKSTSTGESMVNIVLKSPMKSNYLIKSLKNIVDSIFITSNKGWSKLVYGEGVIHEEIDDMTLLVRPKSFFQTNLIQLKKMIEHVKKIVENEKIEKIVDAYGGIGLFSLMLSRKIKEAVVVDLSKDSISAGIHTAKMNGIKNVNYVNLSFEDYDYPEDHDLIVDPPREGLSKEVLGKIEKVGPEKILYISCNLATFSRDLAKLLSFGYNMQYVTPFDMFPHTYHLETLTLLTKQEVIK